MFQLNAERYADRGHVRRWPMIAMEVAAAVLVFAC
jgi:hypothetical protein